MSSIHFQWRNQDVFCGFQLGDSSLGGQLSPVCRGDNSGASGGHGTMEVLPLAFPAIRWGQQQLYTTCCFFCDFAIFILVGGLEHFLFFPYIGNNHPN